jgi:putative ABC transport system permease protein
MKSSTSVPVEASAPAIREQGAVWRPLRRQGTKLGFNLAGALEAVWSNRLRSLLTTLGIIIGIAAVIGVITLAQGANAYFTARFSQLGTTVLTVQPGSSSSSGASNGAGSSPSLSANDVQALVHLPHVLGVSPVINSVGVIAYSNTNWRTGVQGVSFAYQTLGNWPVAEGSWWSQSDEQIGMPVILLGQTVVKNTFGLTGTDPIGQTVRWGRSLYRVVGVLAQRGSVGGDDQDDIAFVSYTNMMRLFSAKGPFLLSNILVQADSVNNVNQVQQEVTLALEQTHHIPPGGQNDFTVSTPQQLIDQENQSNAALENLLIGLAAISLIVGGIGIMNIMLVSVTERTREIGLRVAVGAQPSDIRNQFLVEALILCAIGGCIAVPFGLGGAYLLTHQFGFPFVPSVLSILLAIGVAAVVGIGFGLYPATRASRLDPIVALRSE